MRAAWKGLTAAGLLLGGCESLRGDEEVPALITQPTAESRAELVSALRQALNGAPVTIADDALTRDSVLIIERAARDATGARLDGRDTGRPERFQLLKTGSDCVLVHERTGNRTKLTSASCQREEVPSD